MTDPGLISTLVLPLALGLFGFIEPCSIGSTLVMVKHIQDQDARSKIVQMCVFAITRGLLIGGLGLLAALVGSAFTGYQRAAWLGLGGLYMVLGAMYLTGTIGAVTGLIGPMLQRLRSKRGAVALGLVFGLNIPACAAPLLLALLALAAAGGASATDLGGGFISLAIFGLALSLPLVAAVFFAPARRFLDRLAALSRKVPRWTGMVLIALGAWSIRFAMVLPAATS